MKRLRYSPKETFKYALLISTAILVISGCRNTYKLSKDDLSWNPYHGGESLIFQSNRGDIDTVFIKEVRHSSVPTDPLAIFQSYREVLEVVAKHSDPVSINGQRYLENSFLKLYSTDNKNTILTFSFAAKKSWFYADSYFKNDIERLANIELVTQSFKYTDVIKLEPQNIEYLNRPEFILAMYWSKTKGYVRYDLKNGLYWELKQ